jgi:putative Mn2+ efflux pump MntP
VLTSAITAAIATVLTWLGVEPGLYVAGVWIAVKVLLVGVVTLVGVRAARRRRLAAPAPRGDA